MLDFGDFLLCIQAIRKTSKWTSLSIWNTFLKSPDHELSKEYFVYWDRVYTFSATWLGIWQKCEYFLNKSLIKNKGKITDFVVFLVSFKCTEKLANGLAYLYGSCF